MIFTDDIKKNALCWILSISFAILFIFPMYFLTAWNLSDIMLVPGIAYIGYVLLRVIARLGTFDVFAYQFSNWFSSWKRGIPKKYQDAYEYKQYAKEKRHDHKLVYLPWLAIGTICLILCIIFSFFPGLGR